MTSKSLLADNTRPTEQQWRDACQLGKAIISAVEDRDRAIDRMGLDRAFCQPAANWAADAPNDYLDAYRLLRTLAWDQVRHLRLRCQTFTGFNLLRMRTAEGPSTLPVPEEIELASEPPPETLLQWRALTHNLPTERIYHPPCALGEIGWCVGDVIMNYETCVCQERVTLLHWSGVLDWLKDIGRPPRILEIGAGYGALAYALSSCFPACSYTICDLPESLLFSGLYLTLAGRRSVAMVGDLERHPPTGLIELVPNYLFGNLASSRRTYDLAINVLSMSEMTEFQVENYGRGLARLLRPPNGLFFEQSHDTPPVNLTSTANVLAKAFPFCLNVAVPGLPITQGAARLWANSKVSLDSPSRGAIGHDLEGTTVEIRERLNAKEESLGERAHLVAALEGTILQHSKRRSQSAINGCMILRALKSGTD
jgi:hypothetical protein